MDKRLGGVEARDRFMQLGFTPPIERNRSTLVKKTARRGCADEHLEMKGLHHVMSADESSHLVSKGGGVREF
jgi:hypothetical protein